MTVCFYLEGSSIPACYWTLTEDKPWWLLSFKMDSVFPYETETSKATVSLTVMSNGYRTLSQHLNDLKKENFSLKLRIYFLEERIQQKYEESSEDVYRTVSRKSLLKCYLVPKGTVSGCSSSEKGPFMSKTVAAWAVFFFPLQRELDLSCWSEEFDCPFIILNDFLASSYCWPSCYTDLAEVMQTIVYLWDGSALLKLEFV